MFSKLQLRSFVSGAVESREVPSDTARTHRVVVKEKPVLHVDPELYEAAGGSPRRRALETLPKEEVTPNEAASASGPAGPLAGAARAFLGASAAEVGTLVIQLPLDYPACPLCGIPVGKMSALGQHLKRSHGQRRVLYECSRCGKTNGNHHSIACHYPKCQALRAGREGPSEVPMWPCEECGRAFGSKSGLSQHKRHVHPATRHLERVEAARPKGQGLRGLHRSCWSEEETARLVELEEKFKELHCINKRISEHLPTKTAKQISDKRRQLARTAPPPMGDDPEHGGDTTAGAERVEDVK